MKLSLTNRTSYSTRALRRFFLAGIRAYGLESRFAIYHIDVEYQTKWRRTRAVHGRATIDGNWVRMHVPRPPDGKLEARLARLRERGVAEDQLQRFVTIDVPALARVFEHELAHNAGLGHEEMTEDVRYCRGPAPLWAHGFLPEHFAPAPPKPKPSRAERIAALVAEREARARRNLARWERRLAAAKTHAKKWRATVAGYERRAAAGKSKSPKEVLNAENIPGDRA